MVQAMKTRKKPVLTIDKHKYEAKLGDKPVTLTYTEFEILAMICDVTPAGSVVPKRKIEEKLWSTRVDSLDHSTLGQHISRLRKKLGADVIVTVPRRGFRVDRDVAHV